MIQQYELFAAQAAKDIDQIESKFVQINRSRVMIDAYEKSLLKKIEDSKLNELNLQVALEVLQAKYDKLLDTWATQSLELDRFRHMSPCKMDCPHRRDTDE